MKKILNIIFVTLGVIFLVVIVAGAIFFITTNSGEVKESESASVEDKNPSLSPTQEKALETFGIDPASVPTSVTAEQEACFNAKLGEKRVAEIKAGDAPTAAEYYKAKDCI